jgi:hypothetical protein
VDESDAPNSSEFLPSAVMGFTALESLSISGPTFHWVTVLRSLGCILQVTKLSTYTYGDSALPLLWNTIQHVFNPHRLKDLDLYWSVTDPVHESFQPVGGFTAVGKLVLTYDYPSDEAMKTIGSAFPNLIEVDLKTSGRWLVRDEFSVTLLGIIGIVQSCRNLVRLHIPWITGIGIASVDAFSAARPIARGAPNYSFRKLDVLSFRADPFDAQAMTDLLTDLAPNIDEVRTTYADSVHWTEVQVLLNTRKADLQGSITY